MIRKIRLISEFMTSQLGKQTTAIRILPNISRSKSNQMMKFGLLIEYDTRNIFLEKSCAEWSGETIPRPFSKTLSISLVIQFVVIVCQVEGYQNVFKLSCRSLAFTSYRSFLKNKELDPKLVSLPHFLNGFWRKTISLVIF